MRQSRPDSGRGFQVEVVKSFSDVPSWISSGRVLVINPRARWKLLHTWIILVIVRQHLVQIGQIHRLAADGTQDRCFFRRRGRCAATYQPSEEGQIVFFDCLNFCFKPLDSCEAARFGRAPVQIKDLNKSIWSRSKGWRFSAGPRVQDGCLLLLYYSRV